MGVTALCLALLLASLSCDKNQSAQSEEVITFGAVYDLSGILAPIDLPSSKGAQLAVDQINTKRGEGEAKIQLILKDGQTDFAVLPTLVPEIMDSYPDTRAFLGLSDTDQVLAAAKSAADEERVFLTSGATSPRLPEQIPNYLFLACFGDNVQAAAAAEWAYNELQARTVSVVFDSTEIYTRLLQAYFVTRFEELGGQVLSKQAYADGEVAEVVNTITPADFIFFSARPTDAPTGIRLIRQAGYAQPIVGGDSYDEPAVWLSYPDLKEVYFTTHAYLGADSPDPDVRAFRTAYVDRYQEEPSAFSALAYDAVQLLVEASRKATDDSPQALLEALSDIQDFPGVTGQISYGSTERIPRKSVTILEVDDGEQRFVKEFVPELVPNP